MYAPIGNIDFFNNDIGNWNVISVFANCVVRTSLHEVCKPKRIQNNVGCWLSIKTKKNEQQNESIILFLKLWNN